MKGQDTLVGAETEMSLLIAGLVAEQDRIDELRAEQVGLRKGSQGQLPIVASVEDAMRHAEIDGETEESRERMRESAHRLERLGLPEGLWVRHSSGEKEKDRRVVKLETGKNGVRAVVTRDESRAN